MSQQPMCIIARITQSRAWHDLLYSAHPKGILCSFLPRCHLEWYYIEIPVIKLTKLWPAGVNPLVRSQIASFSYVRRYLRAPLCSELVTRSQENDLWRHELSMLRWSERNLCVSVWIMPMCYTQTSYIWQQGRETEEPEFQMSLDILASLPKGNHLPQWQVGGV
jgi:hypothetical protein